MNILERVKGVQISTTDKVGGRGKIEKIPYDFTEDATAASEVLFYAIATSKTITKELFCNLLSFWEKQMQR